MLKKSIFLTLFIPIVLFSCKEDDQKTAYISGKYVGFDEPLTLYVRDHGNEINFSNPRYIDTVTTAIDGSFSFNLSLNNGPKEILLESSLPNDKGTMYEALFIEAGDSIYFESDDDYQTPLKNLAGAGSAKLTVLDKTKKILGSSGFMELLDILKTDSTDIMPAFNKKIAQYDAILDSVKPLFSQDFIDHITGNKLQEAAYFLQILPSYLEMYEKKSSFIVDTLSREKAFDAMYAFAGTGYKNFNFGDQLYYLLLSKLPKTDTVSKRIDSYMQQVNKLKLPAEGNQLMISKGVLYFLSGGKIKEIEPTLDVFYKQYPTSSYTEELKKLFAEWSALSPGHMAPDFTATDRNDGAFKLSDLKGKVVYIDIWATWCGPCREEFPYTTEIKEHYKDNSNIVFLYVGVGENKEAWIKFLDENAYLTGTHVFDPGNFDAAIVKTFKVSGIPRYVIIDGDGKIFSTDAIRPSEGEMLINQLDAALKISGIVF